MTAVAKLRTIWKAHIYLKLKIKLLWTLNFALFLYAYESWTLTTEMQQKKNSKH